MQEGALELKNEELMETGALELKREELMQAGALELKRRTATQASRCTGSEEERAYASFNRET